METVTLSRIVMKFTPDLYPFLKPKELETQIFLRDGLSVLNPKDVVEIVHQSIYEQQKDTFIH
ncbi:hypothetical protein [Ferviditalea candida]|uniref:Uncharacterized protein n=1 Tax=Ferviditalea candida TaxID=3108399 RepID=A0ABU5ZGM5_9BACL|nr:hypothetical protein [Paenibacillaceae bacterium T2]